MQNFPYLARVILNYCHSSPLMYHMMSAAGVEISLEPQFSTCDKTQYWKRLVFLVFEHVRRKVFEV